MKPVRRISRVHDGNKLFKYEICDYACFITSYVNHYVGLVHKENEPFKCEFCDYRFCQKCDWKIGILQQFMNEISRSNVKFVTTDCLEKVTWKNILHQFMKEKPFKCEACEKRSYEKDDFKMYVESVQLIRLLSILEWCNS